MATLTPRYGVGVHASNTGASHSYDFINASAVSATVSVTPNASETTISMDGITQATTLNLVVTSCVAGDKLNLMLKGDATGRTVTLGTGLLGSATTVVLPSGTKRANLSFVFNGTNFGECSRVILP